MQSFNKIIKCWNLLLYILIVIVFVAWCFPALNKSLWTDEAVSVCRFSMDGPKGVFTTPYVATNHPFYSLLAAVAIQIFSFHEITVRMPAVICGCLFLTVLFYYNSKYFGNLIAFGTGIAMLFDEDFMTLMLQARGYTIIYLCAVLVVFSCYQWMEQNNAKSRYCFCAASAAGIWTWPLFCVFIGVLLLSLFCLSPGNRKKEVFLTGMTTVILSFLFYLPMLKSMLEFYSRDLDIFGEKLSWNNFYHYNFDNLLYALGISETCFLSGTVALIAWIAGMYFMYKNCWQISKYLFAGVIGYSGTMLLLQLNTNARYFVFLDELSLMFILYGMQEILKNKSRVIRVCMGIGVLCMLAAILHPDNLKRRQVEILYPIEAYKEATAFVTDYAKSCDEPLKILVCTQRSFGFEFYFRLYGAEHYEFVTEEENTTVCNMLEEENSSQKIILIDHSLFRKAITQLEENRHPDYYQEQYKRGAIKVYVFESGEAGKIIE